MKTASFVERGEVGFAHLWIGSITGTTMDFGGL